MVRLILNQVVGEDGTYDYDTILEEVEVSRDKVADKLLEYAEHERNIYGELIVRPISETEIRVTLYNGYNE